jgi:hypothetical protein
MRCYDPARMSSAATAPAVSRAGSMASGLAWTALAIVVALGAAGLDAMLLHPPGGPSRAELTYPGDAALRIRLDGATKTLKEIADNVDRMAAASKAALGAIASADANALQSNLERGNGAAVLISQATLDLRQSLAGLPGDGPDATIQFSNATLVRRAEILAAMDAALTLAEDWANVTGRSLDAARVTTALQQHDSQILDATNLGVVGDYQDAVAKIDTARITLDDVQSLRNQIVATGEVTVLDEWIAVHERYDNALEVLYKSIIRAKGRNTLTVQAAAREEKLARAQLPADNKAIVVIVAQIAQGGLNQAVLAINDAQGRIERALEESAPS